MPLAFGHGLTPAAAECGPGILAWLASVPFGLILFSAFPVWLPGILTVVPLVVIGGSLRPDASSAKTNAGVIDAFSVGIVADKSRNAGAACAGFLSLARPCFS